MKEMKSRTGMLGWLQLAAVATALVITISTHAGAQNRPFRIIVLGDSIMWGQGLPENEKFTTRVKEWVETRLKDCRVNRSVELQQFAHSGAVIGHEGDGAADRDIPGELPRANPTIYAQVAMVPNPKAVDAVIMNGGINSVGLQNILTVDPTIGDKPAWVRKLTERYCGDEMKGLLARVGRTFQNAEVIAAGYYQIVSPETPEGSVRDLVTRLHLGVTIPPSPLPDPPRPKIPLPFPPSPLGDARNPFLQALKRDLEMQSRAFYEASDESLQRAADQANDILERERLGRRVHFVRVTLDRAHALGTADTWLWQGVDDPLAQDRAEQYSRFGNRVPPYAPFASIGHPNRQGANAYRLAVVNVHTGLNDLMPRWGVPRVPTPADRMHR